jgi:lysophospholipase L1-like esterase
MDPRRLATLSAAFLLLTAAIARAQNCANTSTGSIPLNDLGTGTYQGFQGGLYPGGTNVRPFAHTVGGLSQAAQVVPRDAAGNPDPAGRIVFLSIGMSNCTQEYSRFVQLANADPLKRPSVAPVDGAQGGQTAAIIQDPTANFWTVVQQRLASAGVTAQQVQVIWFKEADAGPTSGFPAYANTLKTEFETIMGVIRSKYPNARICYVASRIYGGYATTTLNPEPYAYEQGFSCRWMIEDQIQGLASLNYDPAAGPVISPWIDWGTYNWADGLVPRSDGLVWQCSDYVSDGTHPSASGREKVAQALLAFVHADPTAAAWYLRQPAPEAYGVGKTTSLGTLPSVGWTGTPSFSTNDFAFTYTNAVPNKFGLGFFGATPADQPFLGGTATRWVGNPFTRLPVHLLDGSGGSSWAIPITSTMVGSTRFYQGWSRDPHHPDGTGVVATDGLRVVFFD